jgi:hypothetical protein
LSNDTNIIKEEEPSQLEPESTPNSTTEVNNTPPKEYENIIESKTNNVI